MFREYDTDGNGVVDQEVDVMLCTPQPTHVNTVDTHQHALVRAQELLQIFKHTTHGIAKFLGLAAPKEPYLRQLCKAAFR
jgi:hypothetical protein